VWPLPFDDSWFDRQAAPAATSPDALLTVTVSERLAAEPCLSRELITVEVQNGIVTLFGTASSLYARISAAEIARRTPGVSDICNQLRLPRVADATDALPDPFDDLIARWDDESRSSEQHARHRRLPRLAAVLTTIVVVVLWIILLPRMTSGGHLILALACLTAAGTVAMTAGYAGSSATGENDTRGHTSS
jgi:hypothetical protein